MTEQNLTVLKKKPNQILSGNNKFLKIYLRYHRTVFHVMVILSLLLPPGNGSKK